MARIVLAIAIGVVALLVPACGGSGAGEQTGSGGQAAGASGAAGTGTGGVIAGRGGASANGGSGGMVNRADWIDWTAPALP